MMRNILLCVVLGLVVAGGYNSGQHINLRAGRNNVVTFGCGAYGADGSASSYDRLPYRYTFNSLPSWLSASGNSISGTPPSGQSGPWYVNVGYQGAGPSGSTNVALYCNQASGLGSYTGNSGVTWTSSGYTVIQTLRTVTYSESESGYSVLVPILKNEERVVYDKTPDLLITSPAISCFNQDSHVLKLNADVNNQQVYLSDLRRRIADLQAALDKLRAEQGALEPKLADTQSQLNTANSALNSCRQQAASVPPPTVLPGQSIPRTETVQTVSYLTRRAGH